jgi:K+-sensing histidine kinase KdpD
MFRSISDQKRALRQAFSPYVIAVIAVSFAVVSTLRLGSALKDSSTLFFYCVMLSSWYGGLLPGLFAAGLSWLALDYYFIPPVHSLAMNPQEMPGMIVFGAAACFLSWLNSGQRWVKQPLAPAQENEPDLSGIVVKFILAVSASLASCVAAVVTIFVRAGGSWEYPWTTIGLASCCSAFLLIILACRGFH